MVEIGLAVAAAALASICALPEGPRSLAGRRLPRSAAGRRSEWRRLWLAGAACVVAALSTVLAARPHVLVLAAVASGITAATVRLRRSGGERILRSRRRRQVIDLCDALVAELLAGQPVASALRQAVSDWPELDVVAAAAALGGDVPSVLRVQARRPGAEPLTHVAAGWEVAQRSGAGLAEVLDRLSLALRSDEDVRLEITGSLGPARSTARLLAVLPVVGAALGMSLGADPLDVLLGSMLGAGCLAVGAVLAVAGLFWVERIAAAAEV